jgi:hypothetical protein
MRIMILALPLLALGACNVTKDDANDSMTVQYDQNTAENAAADVGNFAENVGAVISNDVDRTADKVQNTDVDVDVDANASVDTNKQ